MDQGQSVASAARRKQLSTELRAAIWEAHRRRCAYTGDPIAFSELEIDHIVPVAVTSGVLYRLKAEGTISDDFDLNGVGNLLPTQRHANGTKSDRVRPRSVLLHFLDVAEQRRKAIEERLATVIGERKLLTAYLELKAQAERNSLDVEYVIDIHRQQEGMTRLRQSPELAGAEDVTLLNAELARALLTKPFALGGGGKTGSLFRTTRTSRSSAPTASSSSMLSDLASGRSRSLT